ncbi:MAG: D-2-hydroxyacid dehydrogenase [Cyclobacteriaceae bacterium]
MSENRIILLDADTIGNVPNLDRFDELGDFTHFPHTKPDEVAERIRGCSIVITNKVPIRAETLQKTPSLRLICVAATGMNNIDLSAAKEYGVEVKNVENYSTHSVAQVTIGLVLQLLHRHDYHDEYVKSGKYSRQPLFTHLGHQFWQLKDRQYGIIGLGNIGRQVAHIAEAMGAKVAYYSTSGKNNDNSYKQLSLEELLQTSDVLSIHAPLNKNTENLIGYQQLALMPQHALLVNTGRGGIVNEADLARAIDEELIGAAAIDVFRDEPFPLSHPYFQVQNRQRLLLTPHIGWASIEARTLLKNRVYDNIKEFLNQPN